MVLLLLGLAHAAPPMPDWGATDREAVTPPVQPVDVPANPGSVAEPRGVRSFAVDEMPVGAWADEDNLVVSFSGDVGRLYYIMGTVRGEGLVAHFRQGPIAGENLTVDVPVALPEGLDEPMAAVGTAQLSLRLSITTLDGRPLAQQPLARTQLSYRGGAFQGAAGSIEASILLDDTFAPEPSEASP